MLRMMDEPPEEHTGQGSDGTTNEEYESVHDKEADAGAYECPMHPEVRSSGPGRCPKCGMPLGARSHPPITEGWPFAQVLSCWHRRGGSRVRARLPAFHGGYGTGRRHRRRLTLRTLLDEHLGVDSSALSVVSTAFPPYDHVNVQVAITAFLEEEGRSHRLIGLTGQQRHYSSLSDLLETAHMVGVKIGAPDLVRLPTGPSASLDCVQFGLLLIEDRGTRLAIMMRGPSEHGDQPGINLEIVSADSEHVAASSKRSAT